MNKLLASFAVPFLVACSASAPDFSDTVPDGDEPQSPAPSSSAPSTSPPPGSDLPGAPAAPRTTDLYHSVKGDPKNQPVVFIHGGPGANSMMFELTVQESIAKLGFYVVAYDQRGSTRSPKGTAADHSFAKATQDLDDLVASLGLVKPILLGHSFGGTIALHYLERFPGKAKGAVVVATPIDFPNVYDTTLVQCASRYRMWGRFMDAQNADALRAKMFPRGTTGPFTYGDSEIASTIECQSNAMLYFPPMPTQGDMTFMMAHGQDATVKDVNEAVGAGFQANDEIGHANLTSLLAKHGAEVAAIYAPSWDVMFSKSQLASIQSSVRAFFTVANAGHFIFMDQPEAFTAKANEALRLF